MKNLEHAMNRISERQVLTDVGVADGRGLTEDFDLRDLRHQNPFWQIVPWPNAVLTMTLTDILSHDVQLPSGAQAIRISRQTGKDVAVNIKGGAVPTADNAFDNCGPIVNPDNTWYYVGAGIRSVSVASLAAAMNPSIVSIEVFVQL